MDARFDIITVEETGHVWITMSRSRNPKTGLYQIQEFICDCGVKDFVHDCNAFILKELLEEKYEVDNKNRRYDMAESMELITSVTAEFIFTKVKNKTLEECGRKGSTISFKNLAVACITYKLPKFKNQLDWSTRRDESFLFSISEPEIEDLMLVDEVLEKLQNHPELWLYFGFDPKELISRETVLTPEIQAIMDTLEDDSDHLPDADPMEIEVVDDTVGLTILDEEPEEERDIEPLEKELEEHLVESGVEEVDDDVVEEEYAELIV